MSDWRRMELSARTRSLAALLTMALVTLSACSSGQSSVAAETGATTSIPDPFANSKAVCELLVTEGDVSDFTSSVGISKFFSADESACQYRSISPAGIEIVTITVAIPSDPDPLGLWTVCAVAAWGEESLVEMEDLGEGAFAVMLPNSGVLIQFVRDDVIVGIGVMSSFRAQEESVEAAIELAHIADGVLATGQVTLGDGRDWPPPGCG